MSSLIKFGTITRILRINPAQYQVRLDNQVVVVVDHGQIQPKPLKPLREGARLSVYEMDGKVRWASTDLSSKNNASSEKSGPALELKVVTVVATDRQKGVVTFQDEQGQVIKIRLPIEHAIWQNIFRGRKLELEIKREADGRLIYSVVMPAAGANRNESGQSPSSNSSSKTNQSDSREGAKTPPFSHSEHHQTKDSAGSDFSSKPREDHAKGQDAHVESDQVGIDPAYFAEREKEGHRHEIMSFLTEHLRDDVIEWYRMRPKKDAKYGEPIKKLDSRVSQALRGVNPAFSDLFFHQARALDSIRADRNLIVVTQTASGKTLCYNPAIFEHFISNDPSARALYIFPLNALMMDQKEKIDELRKSLNKDGISIDAEVLVRGMGPRRREVAKRNPQIVATNPELLSWILLDESEDWRNFLSNLRYIVVDEVHSYRGIQGLHMAGILRRLLLQARRFGAEPKFILSSATVSNPRDLAVRLTSLPEASFDLLDGSMDGSAQAYKHWIVVNPDSQANGDAHDNYLTTAAMTMLELLSGRNTKGEISPLNTILFAKSIRDVNRVFRVIQDNIRNYPHLYGKLKKYISAELSTEDKREIYEGLKSGQVLGVVSTNALGAGIDIGKLDACIIAGFPFSVMDMRQMAGRVGRRDEGLIAFIPRSSSAVDQFYRLNPELLLKQPPEEFVVDPTNPYIARKHINAAAYHLGWMSREELGIFGAKALETAQTAVQDRVMYQFQTQKGLQFKGTKRSFSNRSDPYAIGSIRSREQIPYALCKAKPGQCKAAQCLENGNGEKCKFLITTLDRQYAYRDSHPGAIYEDPDGMPYRVLVLDDRSRVIYLEPIDEHTLERTFVEGDISIKILGEPKAGKKLPLGAELQVGEVYVTRSFTGYYSYTLIPQRRCHKCRKEYEEEILICPICKRKTSLTSGQSKREYHDFPKPYNETGLHITLKTIACWLKVPAGVENKLHPASPCKLPGDQNQVLTFLKRPLQLDKMVPGLRLSNEEQTELSVYHEYVGTSIRERKGFPTQTLLFPGVYGQCLLSSLRSHFPEGRSLELFQAATRYPVTENLRHVCRKCQTSVLLPAMHTLEHTVLMRYPSVALGDISDLGSYTALGHPDTGTPTIFWYDNYDGGLGAAEKVFEKFPDLLGASETTLKSCTCRSLEGCPHCTHIGHCDRQNNSLSKVGLLALTALLLGKQVNIPFEPFIYHNAQKKNFESSYKANEYVKQDHGVGEEAPESQKKAPSVDPYLLLRIQKSVHDPVLAKAFEVRGEEITDEVPPISVETLNDAYHEILNKNRPSTWDIRNGQDPYQVLEILPAASLPMISKVYRVIARQVHPDTYSGDKNKANEMMKLVNDAFAKVQKEKRR